MDPKSDKKITALVVDDDTNIALALKIMLYDSFPCEKIDTAADGDAAWKLIQRNKYDLIISDWNMPNMNGMELLAQIRQDPRTISIPFLMLTARNNPESVLTALDMGVTEYIIKPFENADMVARIEKLLYGKTTRLPPKQQKDKPPENTGFDEKLISLKVIELIGKGEVCLPALPQVVFTIEEKLKNADVNVQDIAKLIEMDVGIASKFINVANSAFYRSAKEYKTLEEAVMRIGIQQTRQLILLISNKSMFELKERRFRENSEALYLHALACGKISKMLAEHLAEPNPHDYFLLGMFHDIGKLLVLTALSSLSRETESIDVASCMSIMDALHTKAGFMLLSRWEFPPIFSHVAFHHDDISAIENPARELLIVYYANLFSRELGFSLKEPDVRQAANLLNLPSDVFNDVGTEVKKYMETFSSMF